MSLFDEPYKQQPPKEGPICSEVSSIDISISDLYKGNNIFHKDSWETYFEIPLQQCFSVQKTSFELKKSKSSVNIIEPNLTAYYTVGPKNKNIICFKDLMLFMKKLPPEKKFWLALKSSIGVNIIPRHSIEVTGFSFGTLQKFTQFNEHFNFPNINYYANCEFDHDKKQVNLSWKGKYSKEKASYTVRLEYKKIHRIIISCNSSENQCITLYIHFKFTPLVFNKKWERITSIPEINLTRSVLEGATFLKIILPENDYVYQVFPRLQKKGNLDLIICNMTEIVRDIRWIKPCNDFNWVLQSECFGCSYAWMLIFNRYMDFADQYMEDEDNCNILLKEFVEKETQNHLAFQKALENIFHSINAGNIFFLFKALKEQFDLNQNYQPIKPPKGFSSIRKVIVTPTKKFFLPPQQHFENRIIRDNDPEFFLQVVIKDDSMEKITNSISQNQDYLSFLRKNLRINEGIRVVDRLYTFLACSNSQLREHSFWMYAEDDSGKTSENIRKGIGFEDIGGSTPKVLSRMGLCFSKSSEGHSLDNYIVERDITVSSKEGKSGMYTFSDGIGRISREQAVQLWEKNSSAAQIRFAGFKGMLCIDPTLDGKLTIFRDSMKKFEYKKESLIEILKVSRPRELYLNRQLIAILEDKAIKPEHFMNLQKEMIMQTLFSLLDERTCLDILKCQQFIDCEENGVKDAQLSLLSEPFFRSIILSIAINKFDLLLHKARIEIPFDWGRNMFGVLDEYGVLEPGQVFVQYTTQEGVQQIHQGKVIVTKNPCMDPGNVKVLDAVTNSEIESKLQHIKDCIVFPSKGQRPIINEMSGADLDGDEYVVMWYPTLIFSETENKEALDYSSPKNPDNTLSTVKPNDLIDFIYRFLKEDNVGTCANSHLAFSDLEGLESKECKHLAQIYPAKLDFLKHGENTNYNDKISAPHIYPDFMMKAHYKTSYRSKNVLGSLYRKAKIFQLSIFHAMSVTSNNVTADLLFEYENWREFEDEAKKHLENFNYHLQSILSPYGFSSIEESLSSINYNFNMLSDSSKKEGMRTFIDKGIFKLCQEYNKKFREECQKYDRRNPSDKVKNRHRRASAWYMVTYTGNSFSLLFPWCIANVLCDIRTRNITLCESLFRLKSLNIGVFEKLEEDLQHPDIIFSTKEILFRWAEYHSLLHKENRTILACIIDFYLRFIVSFQEGEEEGVLKEILFFFEWVIFDTNYLKSFNQLFVNKLKKVAAYTMVLIPITRDLKYLGLGNNESAEERMELYEGETLKIEKTKYIARLLESPRNIDLLKKWSGVKDIIFQRIKYNKYKEDITLKAYGLKWQLCVFEEIVYNGVNLEGALLREDDTILIL